MVTGGWKLVRIRNRLVTGDNMVVTWLKIVVSIDNKLVIGGNR